MKNRGSTITDVARQAGTSPATVSRYFSNPESVHADTGRRIEDAANALSYIRNRAAAATRGQKTGTIGMVVPTFESSIFAELIEHLTTDLGALGQTVLIASNHYDLDREVQAVKTFAEHGVDGVILIGGQHDPAINDLLEARGIQLLCVWNLPQDKSDAPDIDVIGIDNFELGYAAAVHILDLGHRDIACIFGTSDGNDRAQNRQKGILSAIKDRGVTPPAHWCCETRYDLRMARVIATDILKQDHRPSAVICGNDIIAFATIWAAQQLGLNIPHDLSVMGIGDFKGAAEMHPPLSTIRIPARFIGQMAARRIMDLINSPDENPPRHLKIDFEIKMRKSTKPYLPPSGASVE